MADLSKTGACENIFFGLFFLVEWGNGAFQDLYALDKDEGWGYCKHYKISYINFIGLA